MTETVNVDRMVVEYAITALRGSADNGDQYCVSQLEEALGRGPLKEPRPFKVGDKVICSRAAVEYNKGRRGTVN